MCYGAAKPTDLNFTQPFIDELVDVIENGIVDPDTNTVYQVELYAVICDAPGHSNYVIKIT